MALLKLVERAIVEMLLELGDRTDDLDYGLFVGASRFLKVSLVVEADLEVFWDSLQASGSGVAQRAQERRSHSIAQLLGTMAGLKNIDLRVPHHVSIISFDGFHPAEGWAPSITSLHQDIATISTRASALLMNRIAGATAVPQTIRIPPRLQVRQSCRAI